ncbi:NADH-cytochrome b-5 reductase [Colletotrichum acutatum]|uniref:NADH-cytochrome b-5 reductase n=1 Tax=Glomerella acutata TaxID=27357 RepID=A0AAD8UMC5_GLOAC|nr:NADH-cytochrome b-5 reductase [Colletotrichum acutatum]KAK1723714.1 NADH-cytochrome b-5 reductase [Colletotrichum acutatum]
MGKEPGETSTSHIERTAAQPRDSTLHSVTLVRVNAVNENIRLFRLGVKEGSRIEFLPGQWLDTYVPGVPKAGGFTLTSPPSKAVRPRSAYLELAVQKSPTNPAAAWLWGQPVDDDENENEGPSRGERKPEIQVRIGGSFVWPAPGITDLASLRRIAFIAGGVGVNPLMSIVSHLAEGVEGESSCPYDVQFMYSTKAPSSLLDSEEILFMERLAAIFGREKVRGQMRLFLTGLGPGTASDESVLHCNEMDVPFKRRRMGLEDVAEALGPEAERGDVLVYVCGIPSMTDELVESLTSKSGLNLRPERVLCEKWW